MPVYIRTHNLFTTGDGYCRTEVGLDERLHRRRGRQARLRLDDHRPHLRHVSRQPASSHLVEIGFMPEAHVHASRSVSPRLSEGLDLHWLDLSAEGLSRNGRNWSFSLRGICVNATAMPKSKPGCGKSGTSQTSTIGRERPKNISSCTTIRWMPFCVRYPGARVGGPDSTGPGSSEGHRISARVFGALRARQNFATGKTGRTLDFISFHPKGSPKWLGDHVQMGIVTPTHRDRSRIPDRGIVSGVDADAHCAGRIGPGRVRGLLGARKSAERISQRAAVRILYSGDALEYLRTGQSRACEFSGEVNWSFEFEDQPYFAGFREMASNGLDKPVLNTFRMFGMLGSKRIAA